MEPERPIEKLLRESATKRRDAAGEPLQLHPATRRLLQGEVARTFGATRVADGSTGGPGWAWPRLAWGGAVLAGLVAATSLMLPRENKSRHELSLALNTRQLASEARRERVAPLPTPEAESAAVPAPARPMQAGVVQNSPADANGEKAQLPAASAGASAKAGSSDGALPRPQRDAKKFELASKSVSAPTPSAPALAASEKDYKLADASSAGVATVQRFSRVVSSKAKARTDESPKTQAVLASFALEQRGQAVRVVDSDGSVYVGSLQVAESINSVGSVDAGQLTRARSLKAAPANQKNAVGIEEEKRIPYSFRVAGTNRSLNEQVVFTGQILAATNLVALAQATNAVSRGGAADKFGAAVSNLSVAPMLNTRISGTAVIGGGQAIEVNAEPAQP